VLLLSTAWSAVAAEHPTLVNLDSTACKTCHEDLLDPAVDHAPVVEDCTTCHDVTIGDSGTTVGLSDAEPALCVMCHDDLAVAVDAELETPHYPVTESCLTCHDAHSSDQQHLLISNVTEICTACHDRDRLRELPPASRLGNSVLACGKPLAPTF
jgi:predicted CXXCH cytochrome family protein